ncbi:hypothetical protein [Deinococcus sp. UYEF24]
MKNLNWKALLAEGLALLLKTRKTRRSPLTRVSRREKLFERGLAGLEKRLRKSSRRVRY